MFHIFVETSTLLFSGSGTHSGLWWISSTQYMFIQFTSDYSVQTTGISIKYVSSDRTVTGRIFREDPENYVRGRGSWQRFFYVFLVFTVFHIRSYAWADPVGDILKGVRHGNSKATYSHLPFTRGGVWTPYPPFWTHPCVYTNIGQYMRIWFLSLISISF